MVVKRDSDRTHLDPHGGVFAARLAEIDMFFQGNDGVHQTMRRVATALSAAGISYAIVGGMAVNAHRHERTTRDIDFLLTSDGFKVLLTLAGAAGLNRVPGRPRRFVDGATGVMFDVLVTGHYPGSGSPGPIAYPDPADVAQTIDDLRVVDLVTLVQLKLAAHRYQDFADVVNLIRANNLDEAFSQKLHPAVRNDYTECFEEKQREDDYEARQDRAFEDGKGPAAT